MQKQIFCSSAVIIKKNASSTIPIISQGNLITNLDEGKYINYIKEILFKDLNEYWFI